MGYYADDDIVGYRLQRQQRATGQITEHIRCVLHWDETVWGTVVHTYTFHEVSTEGDEPPTCEECLCWLPTHKGEP